MADSKEIILAKRKGFEAGGHWRYCRLLSSGDLKPFVGCLDEDEYAAAAKAEYPLPKVTRPRIVKDGDRSYRLVRGQLEVRSYYNNVWESSPTVALAITAPRIKLWADLLANPTETVEDDGE